MIEDFFKLAEDGDRVTVEDCLRCLSEEEQKHLAAHTTRASFKAGDEIIKQGYLANQLLLLEDGYARLDICNQQYKRTIQLIKPFAFIGIICTFASRTVTFSSSALTDCQIRIMDRAVFEKLLETNGRFAHSVVRMISGLASNLVYHMTRFDGKQVEGALAMVLLEFADTYSTLSYQLPLSRIELARMLGYSKESIVSTLSRFNREGLVLVQERTIHIPDRESLESVAKRG